MAFPTNILQNVQTYQLSGLALLQNQCVFVSTANTKFKDFDKLTANLGDTVTFDSPPRFTTANGLVVTFQAAAQEVVSLTVDQAENVSYAFTAQQFIFNVDEYMDKFGKGAIAELATSVDSNVAEVCVQQTYKFFGNGITPINTSGQLASALALHRNFGAPKENTKGYLEDLSVAQIVNSNLNQFVPRRNDEESNSWELGDFSQCDWYKSNLLPVHTAGTIGEAGSVLTVVSTTINAAGGVTSITFSGAGVSDADAVKQYDKFQFSDGVSGQPNMRFLTYIGHKPSAHPVQFQATADAASTAGSQVTVTINPALQSTPGRDQNINNTIVAGMQVTALPSHRAGLITSGNPLFLAMPMLPDEDPYKTGNAVDPDTGVSIRQYYGSLFGQNQRGMVHDCIWGKRLVDHYSTALIFPL